jgi:tripartite-type tricarboxylate transporter receptor subunit TctC
VPAAQAFPNQPIVIVDPATPGSSTDIFSRALAEEMVKLAGQPVIVENKSGAAGALASEFVARAKPDGHTLGLVAVSTMAANPALYKALKYDPVRDFAPITTMVTLPSAIVVVADSPFQTLTDLLEAARHRPGAVSFASPGVGTAGHILLEQFSQLAGVRFLHVPYRGSSGMFNDLFGGQLQVVSDNIASVLPHVRSGRLRALAVRDVQRSPQLPGVPSLKEHGFEAVSYPLWFGLVAPASTPAEVVQRLNTLAHEAMRGPEFQRRVQEGGATYAPSTPEQFQQLIQQWLGRFKAIVEQAGIKPE